MIKSSDVFILIIFIVNLYYHNCYQPRFNSKYFRFKESNIHYIYENKPLATSSTISNNNSNKIQEEKPVLLFIPGFGVGSFHFESNIESLSHDYNVFCVDLLGQGLSWPDDPNQKGLCYSTDLWSDQIIYMITNIIKQPVHLAGNSLGGFLSLIVASKQPKLIKSLNLLNPTPFWAFQENTKSSSSSSGGGWSWDGSLPAPTFALKFGTTWFNLLRNPTTVKTMLSGVYYNPNACDDILINNIIKSASFDGGPEAFTSIAFAPRYKLTFDELIKNIPSSISVNMIMGGKDPWIVPYWAQRAKRLRPSAVYLELDKCGHCPNHESPTTTNALLCYLISSWEMKHKSNKSSRGKSSGVGDNDDQILERIKQFLMEKKEVQFETIHDSSSSSISQLVFQESSSSRSSSSSSSSGEKVSVFVRDGSPRNLFEYIGALVDGTSS